MSLLPEGFIMKHSSSVDWLLSIFVVSVSVTALGRWCTDSVCAAAEWPCYRADARRSGVTDEALQFPLSPA